MFSVGGGEGSIKTNISGSCWRRHHMKSGRRFWEEGWVTHRRRHRGRTWAAGLLIRLPSPRNHILPPHTETCLWSSDIQTLRTAPSDLQTPSCGAGQHFRPLGQMWGCSFQVVFRHHVPESWHVLRPWSLCRPSVQPGNRLFDVLELIMPACETGLLLRTFRTQSQCWPWMPNNEY